MVRGNARGYTLVEVLITMIIVALFVFVSIEVFKSMVASSALRVATQEVYTALIDARNSTLASQDDTVYGVHISTTTVTWFAGGTYNPADPANQTYRFEEEVTATGTLALAEANIIFERLTGIPSASGTIILENVTKTSSSTVTIHGSGLIE